MATELESMEAQLLEQSVRLAEKDLKFAQGALKRARQRLSEWKACHWPNPLVYVQSVPTFIILR